MKYLLLLALVLPSCGMFRNLEASSEKVDAVLSLVQEKAEQGAEYWDKGRQLLQKIEVSWEGFKKDADKDGDGKLSWTEVLAGGGSLLGLLGAGGIAQHKLTTQKRHAANSSTAKS